MKHEALTELQQMEKTLDNTKAYVNKHLPVVAFHFAQTYGFPLELFQEEVETRGMSLQDQLVMIIKFYEKS